MHTTNSVNHRLERLGNHGVEVKLRIQIFVHFPDDGTAGEPEKAWIRNQSAILQDTSRSSVQILAG
eukprot:scaffold267914_cov31-Tisochrysis_lutea.AAC.2